MAVTGCTSSFDESDYTYLMKRYRREGLEMFWYDHQIRKNIKLGELSGREIKDYIKFLHKPKTSADKGWYKIFNDVLVKQRRLKLEKIKSK